MRPKTATDKNNFTLIGKGVFKTLIAEVRCFRSIFTNISRRIGNNQQISET